MEPIELFTLAPCGAEPPVARLLSHGRDVGKVNGREIEAQFRCRRGYVLITSDGNPTEEVAHIYLLGRDFQAVDLVWLVQCITRVLSEISRPAAKIAWNSLFLADRIAGD